MNERILIVEDEETLCESLKRVLVREGYVVETAHNAETALEVFEEGFYDLVLTDIILPGITGIELLKKIKDKFPEQIVIIMTAYASLETAVEALRSGAYDYMVKPVMHEEIRQIVKNALEQAALREENIRLRRQIEQRYDLGRIIGECPAMQKVIREVKTVAETNVNVLLLGEMGTGKELIARAIHKGSERAEKPFIPVNLNAIPAGLFESELFGYLRGSLPGAATSKKGLFEEANGGTVFLREIGDLNDELQAKLCKTIEDQEVTPVGAEKGIKVDLRFIASTRRDIESAVKEGTFSENLFCRLKGVMLKFPPLRERKEDIEPLIGHFIHTYSHELNKTIKGIDKEAVDFFLTYRWPGNVRELRNVIERAILISDDGVIKGNDLPHGYPLHPV